MNWLRRVFSPGSVDKVRPVSDREFSLALQKVILQIIPTHKIDEQAGIGHPIHSSKLNEWFAQRTLARIHRRSRREDVETGKRKCSFESGIMVFTPKTDPEQGAPNRCYQLSVPTASP